MKFYGRITSKRSTKRFDPNAEETEVFADYFESPSIQAAKSHLSKIANTAVLFSYIQSWDNETREFTGKDVRWRQWSDPISYEQDGEKIAISSKNSETTYGESIATENTRFGKSAEYRTRVTLYWSADAVEDCDE